jgi:hypothetical protein
MDIVAKEAALIDRTSLRYAWFDGLLEATCSDPGAVRDAVAALRALAPGAFTVRFEGSLCSILAESKVFAGSDLGSWSNEAFSAALRELMGTVEADSIESTLRRTEVYLDGTREIIYSLSRGTVREISRDRALSNNDLERAPRLAPAPASRATIVRTAVIVVLMLVAAVLVGWHEGIFDRMFAASQQGLAHSTGLFHELLQYEVKDSLGRYEVTVTRGPKYPSTSAEVEQLLAQTEKTSERACVNVVAEGGTIYAQLEDAEHHVIASEAIDLRPLLLDEKRTATCKLPGRISATAITLSLDKGEPKP